MDFSVPKDVDQVARALLKMGTMEPVLPWPDWATEAYRLWREMDESERKQVARRKLAIRQFDWDAKPE